MGIATQTSPSAEAQAVDYAPRDATSDEIESLPHIVDTLPPEAWVAALIGASERFSYYCFVSIWQNYIQNDRGSKQVPGALGLGQSTATAISNGFFIFLFLMPSCFAVISDIWLGRYKTLLLGLVLSLCGSLVMFATALPSSLDNGAGLPGLIVAMILIGLGVGATKATISPFIGDQYKQKTPQLVRQKDGLPAVVDGTRTLQFLYNAFYWFTNIASLSSIPATFLEREFGFWTAYLMAAISVMAAVSLLLIFKSRLVKIRPGENNLPKAIKVMSIAARNGVNLDHAKQSYQMEAHGASFPWGDKFVDELRRGLLACRVIFCFAFFYLAITQMFNNLISQAGQMQLHGVPNDMLQAMAGVACVVFGPIIQALYNFLAKRRISFGPMARIAVAFLICGGGMGYAAGLQKMIYSAGPCFDAPRACAASDGGRLPNEVNVWLQLPVYVALAIAEIFGLVTASEYAYSKAPKNMKSIVQAMVQLSACLGSLMAMALSPVSRDPHLVVVYAVIAGVMGACSVLFWWKFRKYDAVDRELNNVDNDDEESGVTSTQEDAKGRT
ncbi:putative peptide transporter ptr2 [Colletotrichum gloeosporioides]|uniref:Putative peptide transporter ptr2 n=1 Tax=Colletotrichum gloeosporioides TaxID=474922 RepID=A0A8H4FFB9_COLGL|nr:putative peptide transporter ptr2 [Colletotrichum gloeosporioides]KAF3799835.1 putative peptide transporter ptr2 [Colletotrichum gloeosporioides]